MGAVQVPDELQRVIDRHVAEGRATSAAAVVEDAVLRLIEETRVEEDEVRAAVEAGIADIAKGDFETVATPGDLARLHEQAMTRLRAGLAAGT